MTMRYRPDVGDSCSDDPCGVVAGKSCRRSLCYVPKFLKKIAFFSANSNLML